MNIISALDIKDNQIVHGISGERDNYVPPKSYLFDNSINSNIVSSIITTLNINTFYIADLNAIEGNGNNLLAIKKIINQFPIIQIYLDAGIKDKNDIQKYISIGINKVIIGSETLQSLDDLKDIIETYDNDYIMFSIDTINGKVISKDSVLKDKTVIEAMNILYCMGVKNVILLELKRVGSQSGCDISCLNIIKQFNDKLNIFVGGGVKDINDVKTMISLGAKGIIIASAIYNGAINSKNILGG